MIFVIIGIGVFIIAIGLIINVNNARTLLAGYNTMSEKERSNFDIHSYISHFRRFHLFLGISLTVIGVVLVLVFNEGVAGIFLAAYPTAAYIYFIGAGKKYMKGQIGKTQRIAMVFLGFTLLVLFVIFWRGMRDNTMVVNEDGITIEGSYGQDYRWEDIRSAETGPIPEISSRVHGFSMGALRKGIYKTREGERVRLVLNSMEEPVLIIRLESGEHLFFSSSEEDNEELLRLITFYLDPDQ